MLVAGRLQTAAQFHRTTEIANSVPSSTNLSNLLTVHIKHHSPIHTDGTAAYVTVTPGDKVQLWVDSKDASILNLAIHSLSDTDLFPSTLAMAVRRNTPTRIRLADNEQITAQTLPFSQQPGANQWMASDAT